MDAIRLLHPRHYSSQLGRFKSLAFKPSSDGSGISIIDCECILNTDLSICGHIRKYHKNTAGEPPIYWRFNIDILPDSHELEQKDSPSGDKCHYNIKGINRKSARKFFEDYNDKLHLFQICRNDNSAQLRKEDLLNIGTR